MPGHQDLKKFKIVSDKFPIHPKASQLVLAEFENDRT